jgi:peptide methionine sulfoxide reductase MsrA
MLLNATTLLATVAVPIIFGSGCFWGRQHGFVQLERGLFQRSAENVTAVGVYFGGRANTSSPAGPAAVEACYYNQHDVSVYSSEGHAEAVAVDVPGQHVAAAFAAFFSSFVEVAEGVWVREDTFDVGPGYRALLGFPGGMHNMTMMRLLRQADPHNTTFAEGRGGDKDTLGENKVWIYDTIATTEDPGSRLAFPSFQTELCLQFHNNQTGRYPKSYHDLKQILLNNKRLAPTHCPRPEIVSCTEQDSSTVPAGRLGLKVLH